MEPDAFVDTRVIRVARGSGRAEDDVRALISRFIAMRDMLACWVTLWAATACWGASLASNKCGSWGPYES